MSETPSPMLKTDPVLIASRWVCGDLLAEHIAQVAVELIDAGYDEPSIYRVAAEDTLNNRDEAEMLLKRMFSELGVKYPIPLREARLTVARQIAREVAAGLTNPWIAATHLDRIAPHWETGREDISAIYYLADEADWDPGDGRSHSVLEAELIQAFARLAT